MTHVGQKLTFGTAGCVGDFFGMLHRERGLGRGALGVFLFRNVNKTPHQSCRGSV